MPLPLGANSLGGECPEAIEISPSQQAAAAIISGQYNFGIELLVAASTKPSTRSIARSSNAMGISKSVANLASRSRRGTWNRRQVLRKALDQRTETTRHSCGWRVWARRAT